MYGWFPDPAHRAEDDQTPSSSSRERQRDSLTFHERAAGIVFMPHIVRTLKIKTMATEIITLSENTTAHSKLKEFFIEQLQDILWAEKKLVKTLPKMKEAATTIRLKESFNDHLKETEKHVERLHEIFELINEEATDKKCKAMSGIVDEGEDIIDDTDKGSAQRDVGLIFAAQKVEHYEIATYGGLASLARTLGYSQISEILEKTLLEEKQADEMLTYIAENGINYAASTEPE
jgi:ferritin-like metal-binding protein YciE